MVKKGKFNSKKTHAVSSSGAGTARKTNKAQQAPYTVVLVEETSDSDTDSNGSGSDVNDSDSDRDSNVSDSDIDNQLGAQSGGEDELTSEDIEALSLGSSRDHGHSDLSYSDTDSNVSASDKSDSDSDTDSNNSATDSDASDSDADVDQTRAQAQEALLNIPTPAAVQSTYCVHGPGFPSQPPSSLTPTSSIMTASQDGGIGSVSSSSAQLTESAMVASLRKQNEHMQLQLEAMERLLQSQGAMRKQIEDMQLQLDDIKSQLQGRGAAVQSLVDVTVTETNACDVLLSATNSVNEVYHLSDVGVALQLETTCVNTYGGHSFTSAEVQNQTFMVQDYDKNTKQLTRGQVAQAQFKAMQAFR